MSGGADTGFGGRLDCQPPKEPVAWPGIDSAFCDNCGQCIEFCPDDMFKKKEDGSVGFNEESNCTLGRACKKCLFMCPCKAIRLVDVDGYPIELSEKFMCLTIGTELPPGAIEAMD